MDKETKALVIGASIVIAAIIINFVLITIAKPGGIVEPKVERLTNADYKAYDNVVVSGTQVAEAVWYIVNADDDIGVTAVVDNGRSKNSYSYKSSEYNSMKDKESDRYVAPGDDYRLTVTCDDNANVVELNVVQER